MTSNLFKLHFLPAGTLFSIILLAGGCIKVGPDYQSPLIPLPDSWSTQLATSEQNNNGEWESTDQSLSQWWSIFDDPTLTSLIEKAQTDNLSLRQAKARVLKARAERNSVYSDFFPTVSVGAGGARSRTGKNEGGSTTRSLFNASFDASWEIDLFGKTSRSTEAAQASLEASVEEMRDVLITLVSEVAQNYIEVRSFQTLLSIAKSNQIIRKETYDLTLWRKQAGLTTQLDVEQAKVSFEQIQAQIANTEMRLKQALHSLAVLTGQAPASLDKLLAVKQDIPQAPLKVTMGIPADLLRRRPDIRSAERQLAAQTARIGVATAALYPNLSLGGSIGSESLAFHNLVDTAGRTVRGALSGSWLLFDGGAVRAQIDVQTAAQEQALSAYEETVLNALRNVEDALIGYLKETQRQTHLLEAAKASNNAFKLARHQYNSGLINFQTVIETQRSLLVVQEQVANNQAEISSNLVRLFKSLGGGWTSSQPSDTKKVGK